MAFSLARLLVLALGALWFLPVIVLLLCAIEALCRRACTLTPPADAARSRRAFWLLWAVALVCQGMIVFSFWPGGFTLDTVMQLYQVRGLEPLNDWHPVLHTLLHKLFLSIVDHPGFLVAMQGVAFTLVSARAALTAYRFGAPLRWVCVGLAAFLLLPQQALGNIALMKDYPFSYALVWGTLLLAEGWMDAPSARKPWYWVQLILCLFLIGGLRHNGVLPMLFMAAGIIALTLRRWPQLKARLLCCVLAAFGLLGVLKGPVFSRLGVVPNAASPYTTMFCGVAACIHQGGTLSEKTMEALTRAMPLEDWTAYYSRFEGHDRYMYAREDGMNLGGFTAREAFAIYLEALARYPDVVIKDRLDGMNLLWDVTQPNESYNTDYADHMLLSPEVGLSHGDQEDGSYQNPSLIARAYRWSSFFQFPGEARKDEVYDMLLWRSGAWLILLMTLMLVWRRRRLGGMWLAALPALGNIAAMVLAMYHQSFRYVYFVQLCTLCLCLLTVQAAARKAR